MYKSLLPTNKTPVVRHSLCSYTSSFHRAPQLDFPAYKYSRSTLESRLLKFETVAGMMSECLGMLSVSFKRFITSDCFYQMDSIGEITVDTCEKQSNFVPVLRFGDWSDIGKRSYMEDAHICIPNLAEKFGD
ncbi:probable protein phosphatase 2C 27 [Tanacetum coccineum]